MSWKWNNYLPPFLRTTYKVVHYKKLLRIGTCFLRLVWAGKIGIMRIPFNFRDFSGCIYYRSFISLFIGKFNTRS